MSDSVRPHRQQPTRLPCPWDSPGKNTGMGCHFLLQCMKVKSESEVTQSCPTLSDPMDCSLPGSSVRGIFQARVLEWVATAFSAKSSLGDPNVHHRSRTIDLESSHSSSINSQRKMVLSQIFRWRPSGLVMWSGQNLRIKTWV